MSFLLYAIAAVLVIYILVRLTIHKDRPTIGDALAALGIVISLLAAQANTSESRFSPTLGIANTLIGQLGSASFPTPSIDQTPTNTSTDSPVFTTPTNTALSTNTPYSTDIPTARDTPYPTNTYTPLSIPTPTSTPIPPPTSTTPPIVPAEDWLFILGGNFTMGSSDADLAATISECNETEGKKTGQSCQVDWFKEPLRIATIGDFQITKYEITNAQYRQCVFANQCKEAGRAITDNNIAFDPRYFSDDYPVVGINWNDANTFCQWVNSRLPTESEWEKAARGVDGRRYPWGNTYISSNTNLGSGFPSSIGTFPGGASPYGVMDMAGNVFEWTASSENNKYILRGGSWSKDYFRGRTTDRGTKLDPNFANYDIGFRCTK